MIQDLSMALNFHARKQLVRYYMARNISLVKSLVFEFEKELLSTFQGLVVTFEIFVKF